MCRALFSTLLPGSSDHEFIDGRLRVTLVRLEYGRRERRSVWRVWKMLGLETKSVALAVNLTRLATHVVEEISAVELHPRFGGPHLHRAPTHRFIDLSRQRQFFASLV